jgi:hypothetical protein
MRTALTVDRPSLNESTNRNGCKLDSNLPVLESKIGVHRPDGDRRIASLHIQIANPTSFLAQKILIHGERDYKDRAKDLLYMHDTIEMFSEHLGELCEIFTNNIQPALHVRRNAELAGAAEGLFGKVHDSIREAVLMAAGRRLSAEALAETSRAGLREIFGHR